MADRATPMTIVYFNEDRRCLVQERGDVMLNDHALFDLYEALQRLTRSWRAMNGSVGLQYSGDHPIALAEVAMARATEVRHG